MTVYSAVINLDDTNPRNLLHIFEQDWTKPADQSRITELIVAELESDDIVSLEPWGFKAVAWTSYRNEDGRQMHSTTCRKVYE